MAGRDQLTLMKIHMTPHFLEPTKNSPKLKRNKFIFHPPPFFGGSKCEFSRVYHTFLLDSFLNLTPPVLQSLTSISYGTFSHKTTEKSLKNWDCHSHLPIFAPWTKIIGSTHWIIKSKFPLLIGLSPLPGCLWQMKV